MKTGSIILSIVLATLILFSSIRVSITYAYYELDPIGFIEKLCENKDKPELQCNGKCHLKKIAKQSSDNRQEPVKFISLKEITLFVVDGINLDLFVHELQKNMDIDYTNLYTFNSIVLIDHPPQA